MRWVCDVGEVGVWGECVRVGVWGCVRCGWGGCVRWVCEGGCMRWVCEGVWGCVRVCVGVCGCVRVGVRVGVWGGVCEGVCGFVRVCGWCVICGHCHIDFSLYASIAWASCPDAKFRVDLLHPGGKVSKLTLQHFSTHYLSRGRLNLLISFTMGSRTQIYRVPIRGQDTAPLTKSNESRSWPQKLPKKTTSVLRYRYIFLYCK